MFTIIGKYFYVVSRVGYVRRMCIAQPSSLGEKVLKSDTSHSIVKPEKKCLRISILGVPNAGKSTLVNQLMMRSVCATSSKVHTTKVCSSGIYVEGNTQLVFMDSPGVVTAKEQKKYHLHESYVTSPLEAFNKSDVVGVIQDVSNKHTRNTIHPSIMSMIEEEPYMPKILILNKVDLIKTKDVLLYVTKKLMETPKIQFNDVFMVSASKGEGVEDLRNYFLDMSLPNDWVYDKGVFTDQLPEDIVTRTVMAKLMDNLCFEIPYKLKVILQSLEFSQDGSVYSVLSIVCPNERLCRVVLGPSGSLIKIIAKQCEVELRHAFYNGVFIKLSVTHK